ncbi:histidine phosphatase family protein [Sedimentitalea sp. XS_ASV28]|uniref:histidine phosphatase family protein n=1 Tax=Sedimentitalea sp. XS_ASV28 TaxID=3241296 RepID=UPI003517492E
MIRLALLRHGHTAWNREGRIQGSSDIPLDDDARAELCQFRLPAPWDKADLWSSPLDRARETAQIVAARAPRVDAALSEMSWGDWEGLRGKDLLEQPGSGFRHIEDWGWDYRAPNGESPRELDRRLRPWLDGVKRDAVVVCHIGVMRVLLARAHSWNFDGPAPFRIKRNRLFVLTLSDQKLIPEREPVRLEKRP